MRKIGDTVLIKKHLRYTKYGADGFVRGMEQYLGTTAKIIAIEKTSGGNLYTLDTNSWNWTDGMFEDDDIISPNE